MVPRGSKSDSRAFHIFLKVGTALADYRLPVAEAVTPPCVGVHLHRYAIRHLDVTRISRHNIIMIKVAEGMKEVPCFVEFGVAVPRV